MCVSTLPHRMHLSSCQVITSSCLMAEMCNNTAAPKCALWNFCGRLKFRCGHVAARRKSLHVGGDHGSSRCVRAGPAVGLSRGGVLRGAGVPGAFCMCTLPPTLLPACTLAAGPCSPARGVRILASIRCSARRVSAGRDPSPRPSLLCDSFFPVTARLRRRGESMLILAVVAIHVHVYVFTVRSGG